MMQILTGSSPRVLWLHPARTTGQVLLVAGGGGGSALVVYPEESGDVVAAGW